jgi:ribosomal protein L37AE/L43A
MPHVRPVMVGSGDREMRLLRLGPLISELIAHDLVTRSQSGRFVLRDDLQGHLEEAVTKRDRTVAQVYIGRSCATCGTMAPTRLHSGVRQCGPCRQVLDNPTPTVTYRVPPDVERHRTRPR